MLVGSIAVLGLAGLPVSIQPAEGAHESVTLTFESHGAFFSAETRQPAPIDPQVFVRTPDAAAGLGPQGIRHAASLAPARLADPPATPLYTAQGIPMKITLGEWLRARGTATVVRGLGPDHDHVAASFTGLIYRGVYSLFTVTFTPNGNTFAPLDGMGFSNTFVADTMGMITVIVSTPAHLTHANAVALVYHSDGQSHHMARGTPGVDAHHQLIARVP